jgi:site-specific DNA recombinase
MRTAIYARFSSQLQREASIEDQIRLCRERIEREGWDEGMIFSDRGMSGASMIRPGLQDLLAAAQAGRYSVLVCEALDRLSRDQADVATIYKRLTFAGVKIITLAEGGDQRTACRAQGHDESAFSQGPGRQDPARPARSG